MEQFKEEHQKAFGEDSVPAPGGFPDCGDGRYSEKLSYKDWIEFNNAQRVHQQFTESLPFMLTVILISGLYLPFITMLIAFLNCGTRMLYTICYVKSGSDARRLGQLLGSGPLMLLAWVAFGCAFYDACKKGTEIKL